MVQHIEEHPNISGNTEFSNQFTNVDRQNLWKALKAGMDAIGPPIKTVDGWQNYWRGQKNRVKQRWAKLRNPPTGGGEPKTKPLNDLNHRITNLIGQDAVAGVQGPNLPILIEQQVRFIILRLHTFMQVHVLVTNQQRKQPNISLNLSNCFDVLSNIAISSNIITSRAQ